MNTYGSGSRFASILPSLVSVLVGIFLGWYILFLTDPSYSLAGIGLVLSGGFTDGVSGIGILLCTAAPIILTGLSVGFSIQTGLFNIGASGQFTVGAFTAILLGIKLGALSAPLPCIFAVLGGMLAGALWGFITGALKAVFKVNEIISGIMLNYIGMLLVNLLIRSFIYDSTFNRSMSVPDSAQFHRDIFEKLLPGCRVNACFFIALFLVILIKLLLDRTTTGYELKMTGKNRFACHYAGINDNKNIMLSTAISGALAGVGGALMYLSDYGDHMIVVESILQQGFTGISVALLGMNDPIGILIAGLFIAHISVGGNYLQLFSYTPDLVNMIIAIIVYCGALVLPIRVLFEMLSARIRRRKGSSETREAET